MRPPTTKAEARARRKRFERTVKQLNKLFGVDRLAGTPLWDAIARSGQGGNGKPNPERRRRRRPKLAAALRRRDALTRRILIRSARARGFYPPSPTPAPVLSDAALAVRRGTTQRAIRLERQAACRRRWQRRQAKKAG